MSVDFDRQFRHNFEDHYQRKIIRLNIKNRYELNKKYDKINKNLTRDLRTLSWQHKESFRKTSYLYQNVYKNQISILDSDIKDFKGVQFSASTKSSTVKIDKSDLEPARYKFSKYLSRVSCENHEKEEIPYKSVHEKMKILNHIGIESKNLQRLKIHDNEECQEELHKQFYNPLNHIKNKKTIDFIKKMGTKIEKQNLSIKINQKEKSKSDNNIKPVIEENRIKYTVDEGNERDLDKHVTLFQNLLRGRAYQTMMIMAKIRYEPLLQPFLYPEGNIVEHSSTIVKNDEQDTITNDDIVDYSVTKYVGRFLDIIAKEAIHKQDDEENKRLIKLGELTKVMKEAAEGNRRHKEVTRRKEQDEILKQMIKIHQDISELFLEQFMEEAIDQCAKEEGLQLIQTISSRPMNFKDTFCHNNNKNIEPELVHNFIIPEAYKIINREETN